ncbi:MAG: hypothetical protein K2K82_07680 [Muribaculaceae bacterium]|nr:hypothetical protein [Muribaculaceae bacterium]
MTPSAKTTTINPSEQAELFALLRNDFSLVASAEPLYSSPVAKPIPTTASAQDIISSVRRQQRQRKDFASAAANEKINRSISEQERTKIAYIPFAIAELVWDYADTIIICSKRNKEIAQLSRTIRNLRRAYLKALPRMIQADLENGEVLDNAYIFEEALSEQWSKMLTALLADLQTQYPDLNEESMQVLNAAYQAIILARALNGYIKKQSRKLTKTAGWEVNVANLLPRQYRAMTSLLELYIGDRPASSRFPIADWVAVFANQIGLIEI